MEADFEKVEKWLQDVELAMPQLREVILSQGSEILIIGKSVYYLYHELGWIPEPRTSTGDIDISIGVYQDFNNYYSIKSKLLEVGYLQDEDPDYPFRFHSPKKMPGTITYVDLLIHPAGDIEEETVREKMGVGPEWQFESVLSGLNNPVKLNENGSLLAPNPLGMIGQKARAYYAASDWRKKDLADIGELIDGLVTQGTHFDLSEVWQEMKLQHSDQCEFIESCVSKLADDSNVELDFENVKNDLVLRHYTEEEIETHLPKQAEQIIEQVFTD
ncbi:hypothetical protein [Pseudobacteriovorax antillogorgiicola]|uniref:Uncharacterized protein n=1 Tax=Pseudobacteriovorax antillogorgiicola TaxID=1513793 RepID=A0A1Y6CXE1_9BACT|nr:hypothetical protein [Pseudobacteriovorax antillogorgiicola]TCS41572.1 hypothetical protein EDD56_14711 [Pseudobacteriovorax antillogorgiicola]SMF83326.1 hypothetical protein SAMN06296036_1466 [Pseudobacteriovorax antillogorgiicola]